MKRDDNRYAGALERVKGIEPSYEAWEASVLPLNYTRVAADYTNQWMLRDSRRTACGKPGQKPIESRLQAVTTVPMNAAP